jgi:DNA-binding MarR family transcriptional regulator
LNTLDSLDREIDILENIRSERGGGTVRQRDLARILGISLGMTNVILKKLAQKGWLTIRKINSRHIQYAITPAGLEAIARRSYRYLKRVVKNVVRYKEILQAFLEGVKRDGFTDLALVGASDFDFIIEHLCLHQGLTFRLAETSTEVGPAFVLYAEDVPSSALVGGKPEAAMLRDILVKG